MKKFVMPFLGILISTGLLQAQLIQQAGGGNAAQSERDWYNCSLDKDGVYGAEVNKAYEFLKGRKIKKRPIVAILGGGMDVEHEELKNAIWTNPKEKADGKDNDRNGYTDDINGWNFLGGTDGTSMEITTREGEREFLRLKDRYADYITNDGKFYKFVNDVLTEVPAPEDMTEYYYYRHSVLPESKIGGAYWSYLLGRTINDYGRTIDRVLKEKFPDRRLTQEDVRAVFYHPESKFDSIRDLAFMFIDYSFIMQKTDDWEKIYNSFVLTIVENSLTKYKSNLESLGYDGRKEIVGDDCLNLQDMSYGNNVLLSSDCATAVMQAGIIAGGRHNGMGGDGIADALIMPLRVAAGKGEPYLKDLALAIRYAVNHGADIIVLPEQNTLYPPQQREWMNDAIRYAENKGVLVIVPVWELSEDLSKKTYYPNRRMVQDKELTNLMVVASSDRNGNPSMMANYGAKELDLFAPGIQIYSSYTGDTYKFGTGTAMSAATTAAVAALVKSYYPNLTGPQIRQLLIDTVTSREGEEVEKGIMVNNKSSQDLFMFEELTLSGGIINAYKAVVEADRISGR